MRRTLMMVGFATVLTLAPAAAQGQAPVASCAGLPTDAQLREHLRTVPTSGGEIGGMFGGTRQWAAVVNRAGEICAMAVATADAAGAWPGSQAISKAKAYTANAFSMDTLPISSARLYTLTQPGHSLWSLANANPFDPACLVSPGAADRTRGRICGGIIAFGGGVPLYRNGKVIGGLGTSGDTSCADHEVSKRIRDRAGLNPPGGRAADDIVYTSADGASLFAHPLCPNTYRDGTKIGDEPPAK